MPSRSGQKLTYANVVASLALLVGLGAVAAVLSATSASSDAPRATAVVYPAGTFDAPYTKGFAGVRKARADVFCLRPPTGVDPRRDPASVNVIYNFLTAGFNAALGALWAAHNDFCKTTEYEVHTYSFNGRIGEPSNAVTFSIVVD